MRLNRFLTIMAVLSFFATQGQIANPGTLTNLKLWLSADSLLYATGSTNQWTDLSGNGNNAIQNTSAQKPPVSVSATLNNKPVLTFNGTSHNLRISGFSLSQPTTIICLWNTTANNANQHALDAINTTSNRMVLRYYTGAGGTKISMFAGNSALEYAATAPFGFRISGAFVNGANSTFYENNITKVTADAGSNPLSGLTIGGRQDLAANYFLKGQMAELIIYDRLLTTQEYMDVVGYLQNKYAPPVSLGNDTTVNYGFCPLTLNAAKPWFTTYSWSTGVSTPSITTTNPGTYSVTATDIFGLQSVDTIVVSRPTFSGLTFSPTSQNICAGDSVVLNTGLPQAGYTFNWSNGATTPVVAAKSPGAYTVTVTDTSSCVATSNTVIVAVDSFVLKASLGADTVLCSGGEIGLQSGYQSGLTFSWSTGSSNETIVPNSSGSYSVQITSSTGCVFNGTINVTISGVAPTADFDFDTVCVGVATSFTDLSAGATNGIQWDFAGLQQSTQNNPSFTFPGAGTYNVSLTAYSTGGCYDVMTKAVVVRPNPEAGFIADTTCAGLVYTFQDTSNANGGQTITTWNWDFAGQATSAQQNPTYTFANNGNFPVQLIVTTNQGCKDTALRTLTVIPFNAALAEPFSLYTPAQGYNYTSTSVSFSWGNSVNAKKYGLQVSTDSTFNSLVADTTVLTTSLTLNIPLSTNTYYWRVTAFNRCEQPLANYIRYFYVFTPTLVSNMSLWLAADTAVTLSSGVAQWRDISGNNHLATQATNTFKPSLASNQVNLNGKPSIGFAGGDYLRISPFIQAQPTTAFVIWKANAAGTHHVFDGINSADRLILRYNAGGISMFAGGDVNYTKPSTFNYTLNSLVFNSTTGTLFENGIQKASGSVGTNNLTGLTLGSRQDLNNSFALTGNIAEVIFYSGTLTAAQRQSVEVYLMNKYAPPVNLGPDINQPYKLCAVNLVAGSRFISRTWSTGETGDAINIERSGTYWVEAVDVFGRVSRDTVNVIYPYAGMNVGDTLICSYNPVTIQPLLASSAYDFIWNNQAITQAITVAATLDYVVTITDTTGCSFVSDSVSLEVDSIAFVNLISPTDTLLCIGNTLQLASLAAYPSPMIGWSNGADSAQIPFNIQGTYTVQVLDANGCTVSDAVTVHLKTVSAPTIIWTAPSVCFGAPTVFSNNSFADNQDDINTYHWNFGNNQTSAVEDPTYTYPAPGDYNVTLSVVTDSGCTGVLTKVVTAAIPPIPGFTYPEVICAGVPTELLDQSAFLFGDSVTAWVWTINNADSLTSKNPVYEFPTQGTYEVTLTAISKSGCADSVTETIDVFPPLKAEFGYSNVCFGDSTVFTDLTASLSIVDWQWSLGYDISKIETVQNPKHKYDQPGSYTVTLRVENAIGCVDYESKNITIVSRPTAKFGNLIACEDKPYTPLDSSIVNNDTIAAWKWTIGANNYNAQTPIHVFADSGNASVKLRVTTQNGCVDSVTRTVSVKPSPVALFTVSPLYGAAPVQISFINQSTGASTYLWTFGDGGTSTDAAPFYTYTVDDTFDISLVATSTFGCSDTAYRAFVVAPTDLDIAVSKVNVTKVQQADGSYLIQVQAEVSNVGTRLITDVQFYLTIGSGGVVSEDWEGLLYSGMTIPIVFTAEFVVAAENANSYICVTAVSVNNGETEITTANNSQCTSTNQTIQIIGPSPNPMSSDASIGIIVPKEGGITIDIVNMAGQYVIKGEQVSVPRGRSDWQLPADKMRSGEYFLRIYYNDEIIVRKFIVAKQ